MANSHATQAKNSLLKKTHATRAKGFCATVRNILRVQSETFCVYSQKHSACTVRNIPIVPAKKGFFSIYFTRLAVILALLFCVCGAMSAWGQATDTFTWTGNGTNNYWTTTDNWDNGRSPTGNAIVIFNSTTNVTFDTPIGISGLEFQINNNATVTLNSRPNGYVDKITIRDLGLSTTFTVSNKDYTSRGTLTLNGVEVDVGVPVVVNALMTLNSTGQFTTTKDITNNGTMVLKDLTLTVNGTLTNNGTVKLYGTPNVTAGTITNGNTSTVEFYGTGDADISKMGREFQNLSVKTNAGETKTITFPAGNTTVRGNMTLTGGDTNSRITVTGTTGANIVLQNNTTGKGEWLDIYYNTVSINGGTGGTYDVSSNCLGNGATASGVQNGWLFSNVSPSSNVYYWAGGGGDNNWSTAANWHYDRAGGTQAIEPPGTNANAQVHIPSGTVTLNAAPTKSLASVEITNGAALTISNAVTVTSGTITSSGTVTNNGALTATSYTNNASGILNLEAGSAFTVQGQNQWRNAGTVNVRTTGTISITGVEYNENTANPEADGTWNYEIGNGNTRDLVIPYSSANYSDYTKIYRYYNLNIKSGTINVPASKNISFYGVGEISQGATLQINQGAGFVIHNTPRRPNGNPAILTNNGTIIVNGANFIPAGEFTNSASGVLQFSGTGNLMRNDFTGTGFTNSGTVEIAGSNENFTNFDITRPVTENGTWRYVNTADRALVLLQGNAQYPYNNLQIGDANSSPTVTLNAAVTARGKITVSQNATLDLVGYNVSGATTIANNGTLKLHGTQTVAGTKNNAANSTVEFYGTGTGNLNTIGDTYYDLVINSSQVNVSNNITVNGNLTVKQTAMFDLANYNITVAKAITNDGTIRLHDTQTVTAGSITNGNASTVEFYGDTGASPINVSRMGTNFATLKCDMPGGGEKALDFSRVTQISTLVLNGNTTKRLGITAATATSIALGNGGSGSYLRVNYTNVKLTGNEYNLTTPADNSVGTAADFTGDYPMQGVWFGWRFSNNDAFSEYYWNPGVSSGTWSSSASWLVEFPYSRGTFVSPPDGSFPNNATPAQSKQAFFGAGTAIPAVRISGNVSVTVDSSVSLQDLYVRLPSGASVTLNKSGSGEINVANEFIFENDSNTATANATLTTNVDITSAAMARVSYAANLIVGNGATATFNGSFDGADSTAPIVTVNGNGKASFNSYGSAAQPMTSSLVINDGGSVTANAWHNAGTVTLNGSTSTAAVTLGGGSENGTWIYNNTSGTERELISGVTKYNVLEICGTAPADPTKATVVVKSEMSVTEVRVTSGIFYANNDGYTYKLYANKIDVKKDAQLWVSGIVDLTKGVLGFSNEGTIIVYGNSYFILPSNVSGFTDAGTWIYKTDAAQGFPVVDILPINYNNLEIQGDSGVGLSYNTTVKNLKISESSIFHFYGSKNIDYSLTVTESFELAQSAEMQVYSGTFTYTGAANSYSNAGNVSVADGNATFANAVTDDGTWTYKNTANRNLISNITYNNLNLSGTQANTITAFNDFTVRGTMNINAATTLALGERTLAFNGAASGWANRGTVTVTSGNATFPVNTEDLGTWIYENTSDRTGIAGLTYNNVRFEGNAVTLDAALTAKSGGSITVGSATNSNTSLNTNGNAINASGASIINYGTTDLAGSSVTADSFTNNNLVRLTGRGTNTITTVTNNNSTVEYYGADADVGGAATVNFGTDYYDFVCQTGNKTLLFDRNITVRNNLTLRGVDFDNLITIRSSDDNTVRRITLTGSGTKSGQFITADRDKVRFDDTDETATTSVFEADMSFDYTEANLQYQRYRGWHFPSQNAPTVFYWTGGATGNWTDGTKWTGVWYLGRTLMTTNNLAPTRNDHLAYFGGSVSGRNFNLPSPGVEVNVDSNVSISQIIFTLGSGGNARNVTLSGTNSITVGSMTSVDGNTGTVNANANVNISTTGTSGQAYELIIYGGINYSVGTGAKTTVNSSVFNNGNITVNGEFECANYGSTNVPASGTLTVNGTGTFRASSRWNNQGTVNVNDATNFATINLPNNRTEGGKWIYSNTNSSPRDLVNITYNNLQIANGAIDVANNTTVNGTLTMGHNTPAPATNGTLNVNNTFTAHSVTYDTADSKIVIGNGNSLTVNNSFTTLSQAPTASTKASDAALQIGDGTFTLAASARWNNSGIVSVEGGTANFQTTAPVTDNGTWLYANSTTNRDLIQNISYNNLYLHGTAANDITVPADFTVRGAVDINSDTTLSLEDKTLTLPQTATWKNVGKVNVSTGTLNVATDYALEDDGTWTYTADRNAAKGLAKIRYKELILQGSGTPPVFDLAANNLYADSIEINNGANVRLVGTQTIARKDRSGTPNVTHAGNTKIEYYGSGTATLALADNQSDPGQNTYYDLFVDLKDYPVGTVPATGGKTVNVNSDITVANELRLNGTVANRLTVTKTGTGNYTITLTDPDKSTVSNPSASNNKNNYLRVARDSVYITGTNPLGTGGGNGEPYYFVSYYSEDVSKNVNYNSVLNGWYFPDIETFFWWYPRGANREWSDFSNWIVGSSQQPSALKVTATHVPGIGNYVYFDTSLTSNATSVNLSSNVEVNEFNVHTGVELTVNLNGRTLSVATDGTRSTSANPNTNSGTLTLNGGTFAVKSGAAYTNGDGSVANAGEINLPNNATITVAGGATAGTFTNDANSAINLEGRINNGGTFANSGTVNVNSTNANFTGTGTATEDDTWIYNVTRPPISYAYNELHIGTATNAGVEMNLGSAGVKADIIHNYGTVRLTGENVTGKDGTGTPTVTNAGANGSTIGGSTSSVIFEGNTGTTAINVNAMGNNFYNLSASGNKVLELKNNTHVNNSLYLRGTAQNLLTLQAGNNVTLTIANNNVMSADSDYLKVNRENITLAGNPNLGGTPAYYWSNNNSFDTDTNNTDIVRNGWRFPAVAVHYYWTGAALSNDWTDKANWKAGSNATATTAADLVEAVRAPRLERDNAHFNSPFFSTGTSATVTRTNGISLASLTVAANTDFTLSSNNALTVAATTNSGTFTVDGTYNVNNVGGNAGSFTNGDANAGVINLTGVINNGGTFTNNANSTVNVNSATANFTGNTTASNVTENGTWIYNASRPNGLVNYAYNTLQIGSAGQPVVVDLAGRDLAANSITNNGTIKLLGTQKITGKNGTGRPAAITNASSTTTPTGTSTVEFYGNTGNSQIDVSMMGTSYDNLTASGYNKTLVFPANQTITINGDLYLRGANDNAPLTIASSSTDEAIINVAKVQGDTAKARGSYMAIDRAKVKIGGVKIDTISGNDYFYWADNSYDADNSLPDALKAIRNGWRIPTIELTNIQLSVAPLGGNTVYVRAEQGTMDNLTKVAPKILTRLPLFFNVADSSAGNIATVSSANLIYNGGKVAWIRLTLSGLGNITVDNLKSYYVGTYTIDAATGNMIREYHPLSDFAVGAVNPLFAYDNRYADSDANWETSAFSSGVAVRNWDAGQGSDGSLLSKKDIIMGVRVAGGSGNNMGNPVLYMSNSPTSGSQSNKYNGDTNSSWRVWLPDVTGVSELAGTPNGNAINNAITVSGSGTNPIFNIPAGSNSIYSNWKDGDQITFMFGVTDTANAAITVGGSNATTAHPLYALRLRDAGDINSLDLWSVRLRGMTAHRGGVSIRNNVINVNTGEQVTIEVDMPKSGTLNVMVMTLDGSIVKYLQHGTASEGKHAYHWGGLTNSGSPVARGLYFVRVVGSGIDETRKVMVVK